MIKKIFSASIIQAALWIVCFFFVIPSLVAQPGRSSAIADSQWQYLVVENIQLPFDVLLKNRSWKTVEKKPLFDHDLRSVLWLRSRVLPSKGQTLALYLPLVHQNFAVYLRNERIYQFGNIDSADFIYAGWPMHIIQLGVVDQEDWLYLKIVSNRQEIGLPFAAKLGLADKLILHIVKRDILRFALGLVYLFAGIFAIFMNLRRQQQFIYYAFGFFSFTGGLYSIANRTIEIQHLIVNKPLFWAYLEYFTLYILPVFAFWYLYYIIKTYRRLIRGIIFAHLFFFLLVLLSGPWIAIYNTLNYFFYGMLLSVFLALVMMIMEAFGGNREARIMLIGISVFPVVAVHDILGELHIFELNHRMHPYGFLVFLIAIFYITERRFYKSNRQLELYSKRLAKSKILLEEKVRQRTNELTNTLSQVENLKQKQDGDYFLTSLLIKPLIYNRVDFRQLSLDFYIKQFKEFSFRKRDLEIGGDICIADTILLQGHQYAVFVNADAMGKSLQGASGALVLGAVFQSILSRNKHLHETRLSPQTWLSNTFWELQHVFESFDGSMLVSMILGILNPVNGHLCYVNAEHPWIVLLRDKKATFLHNDTTLRKLGFFDNQSLYVIKEFTMIAGDILYLGSDGRDDIALFGSGSARMINEDENLFVQAVEHSCKGEMAFKEILSFLSKYGDWTDDISLMKIQYYG